MKKMSNRDRNYTGEIITFSRRSCTFSLKSYSESQTSQKKVRLTREIYLFNALLKRLVIN